MFKKKKKFDYYYTKNVENGQKKESSKSNIQGSHPGSINNSKIIYKLDEFYNDGDINNPENIVIRHDINQEKDLKFITEEIWIFLRSIYGGGPEVLCNVIIYNNKKLIEIYLNKYKIAFLPKRSELTDKAISKISEKPVFITKVASVKDFKQKLIRLNTYNNKKIKIENIRVWKLNLSMNLDEFKTKCLTILQNEKKDILMKTNYINYLECIVYYII